MKRTLLVAGALMLLAVSQLAAQALSYDPFYVLPREAGTVGADLQVSTPDVAEIGSMGDVDLMAKYAATDQIEVGARATLGVLNDAADSFSTLTLNTRYSLAPERAVALNLTPYNGPEEFGLSLGIMNTIDLDGLAVGSLELDGLTLNKQLHLGLLKGYAAKGAAIEALIEPTMPLCKHAAGYLDLTVTTNTDDLGDHLSALLSPNVDITMREGCTVNVGAQFSVISGDLAPDTDFGMSVALIWNGAFE